LDVTAQAARLRSFEHSPRQKRRSREVAL
jgi:hypothetical protein